MDSRKVKISIDIHAHPHFIEPFCNDEKLSLARTITGLYKTGTMSLVQITNRMNCAGIDQIVLHPLDLTSTHGKPLTSNEDMKKIVDLCPNRFIGFASVDPFRTDAVEELEHAFKNLGLVGLKLHPSRQQFYPDDPMLSAIFKVCIKYNKPIMFHSGMTTQPGVSSKYSRPALFEDIAINYPDLRFCLAHFGWPWIDETCMLLLKYPNVYADTAFVYFDTAREAYEKVFFKDLGPHWLDRSLRHQVLFGSDDPGLEQIRMANAIRNIGFRESTCELILGGNALKFLGRDQ